MKFLRLLRLRANQLGVEPQLIVGTALKQWTIDQYPGLETNQLISDDQLLASNEMQAFISALKEIPFLEAAYWVSSAYALLVNGEKRKSYSMYFTPPSLTARILDDLTTNGVNFESEVFYDPACGGAAFLASIALRMKNCLYQKGFGAGEVLRRVESNLIGTDLDSTLCDLSKQFLSMALHDEIVKENRKAQFRLCVENALDYAKKLQGSIDVVVCNPPYRKMLTVEVARYRNEYGAIIEGQPNVYGVFIAMCARLLRPSGICALVTPTSFLSGQNFKKLRSFLALETSVLQIGMVSERVGVFIDVEQETALTLFRRDNESRRSTVTKTLISVVAPNGNYVNVGYCEIKASNAPWPIPRAQDDIELLTAAAKQQTRIADYGYNIRIGAFVWNRDERQVYISAATAKRCKNATAVPLLWSSDIKPGRLKFDGVRKRNGEPTFVNPGPVTHPSVVRNPSVILQRVTSNDQPRRLVATAVPESLIAQYGGFVGENHTVILESHTKNPKLSCERMAELINSPVLDRIFRCISGATNVSAYELQNLPLPNVDTLLEALGDGLHMDDAASRAFKFLEGVPITFATNTDSKSEPIHSSSQYALFPSAKICPA